MVSIFLKLMKLQDIIVGLINSFSNLCAYLTFAFSTAGWQMYLGLSQLSVWCIFALTEVFTPQP
jgi:hypothetical protein